MHSRNHADSENVSYVKP